MRSTPSPGFRNRRRCSSRTSRARIDTAVEEVLRWSSPLLHMRRTATQDVVVNGSEIKAGDKVVLWYISGNRDEAVFERSVHIRHPA